MRLRHLLFIFIITISYPIWACTTIIVGKKATVNNAVMIARNDDGEDVRESQMVKIFPAAYNKNNVYRSIYNNFTIKLPAQNYKFFATPKELKGRLVYLEAGFNERGVGISATESFDNSKKVLAIDPYPKGGVVEGDLVNVVLPYITSAADGVKYLSKLVETHGAGAGFGVSFADKNEAWYFETASGHRWVAARIPDDSYFVAANQSRLQYINLADRHDFLGSKDLISFAKKHKLYNPRTDGKFNFRQVYGAIRPHHDRYYDYMRIKTVIGLYNPQKVKEFSSDYKTGDFPDFLVPAHKLDVDSVKTALRNHYQGTENDPYTLQNPKEEYRPISVFRTHASHILEFRGDLPQNIGDVMYLAMGMSALSIYVPFYLGLDATPVRYNVDGHFSTQDSAYWLFRNYQTLIMQNFPRYAPKIIAQIHNFEQQTSMQQKEFETQYKSVAMKSPQKADQLLQEVNLGIARSAMDQATYYTNQLFTQMALDVNKKYMFSGS
jgi:dipeptidase